MIKLTKKMREVLKKADLENGEINDVAMGTMYGLESRQLVSPQWRRVGSPITQTTQGDTFPRYSRVKLTAAGLRAARTIQGLQPDV
jgi:hypothetical protein